MCLKELADENQEVICIDFAKNFGQPSALLAGFAVAQGDYILTSDDDGQCPVGEVFHFWEELQKDMTLFVQNILHGIRLQASAK